MKNNLLFIRFLTLFLAIPIFTIQGKAHSANHVHKVETFYQNSASPDSVKINFSRAVDAPPSSYLSDSGAAFGDRKNTFTYGWLTTDGLTPLDLSANARNRNLAAIDTLQNTLLHMQYGDAGGSNGISTEGIWEIILPNGIYEVKVNAGDAIVDGFAGSIPAHSINVEGVSVIDKYVPTGPVGAASRFTSGTATVTVIDGRLTIDAFGGFNTKINAVEISKISDISRPFFTNVTPVDNATNVNIDDLQINVEINTPVGYELNNTTLLGNIELYEIVSGQEVLIPSNANDTGGGDAITVTPINPLKETTQYVFRITEGIEANRVGDPEDKLIFLPFSSTFTTGRLNANPGTLRDLSDVAFTPVSDTTLGEGTTGQRFSSLVIGPDEKLYASTLGNFQSDGQIFRWTIKSDGTLTDLEVLSPELLGGTHPETGVRSSDNRLIIGLVFDPSSTPDDLIAYITHSSASTTSGPEWDGKLTRLSGPDLSTVEDLIINLPRSSKDHLTNSLVFDPQGNLYINQGSNSAGGEADANWGFRPERLLTAAVLKVELDKLTSLPLNAFTTDDIDVINAAPVNSITMSNGTYNPYATNSPLTIFASGVRNAYDMVWHTNGWLYVPTNGTAGNNNTSPNAPATADYTLAKRIDGLLSIPDVPALRGGETQKDWLFKTKGGSYHGHANPYRGEFVLNHGGISYSGLPGQEEASYTDVAKYPDDLGPDPNYREPAFDFGKNKSPNGVIEYKSNAFNGKLKNLILVARFSGQDDILALDPGDDGDIVESYNTIPGFGPFDDPLDLIEDPRTGNIYVSEYDRNNDGVARLTLLRAAIPAPTGPRIATNVSELLFETTVNDEGENTVSKTIQIANTGIGELTLSGFTTTGAFADQFTSSVQDSIILGPGESLAYQITYAPDLDTSDLGYQEANLTINSNDSINPVTSIGLYALKKAGLEGIQEPTLQDVVNVLGFSIDVGWTTLANGTDPTPIGDEIALGQWKKAQAGPVNLIPVGRYSPAEELPFGWYTTTDSLSTFPIGVLQDSIANAQTLNPSLLSGTTSFDPEEASFGIFVESRVFNRFNFTQDDLNSGDVKHRARIYPLKDRQGQPLDNQYLIAFEDASNGDYQDYLFVIDNVIPAPADESRPTYQFNFQNADNLIASPEGYLDDTGAPYGLQNTALGDVTYGWVLPGTTTPASAVANGRTRNNGTNDDALLKTFTIIGHRDANRFPTRDWLVNLPNGFYTVEVSVGDERFSDSNHVLNANGITVINFDQQNDNPNGLANFNATEFIEVTEGTLRFSLAEDGVNAKPNYIRILPVDSSLVPPALVATFNGETVGSDIYRGSLTIDLNAEARSTASTLTRFEYALDSLPFTSYTDAITITEGGTHTLEVVVEDSNGNSTSETYTFTIEPLSGAILAIENRTKIPGTDRGFPSDNFFTFHRLGDPGPRNARVHDTNIMRLNNTGTGTLIVDDIVITDTSNFEYEIVQSATDTISLPFSITPGSFQDITVRFIQNNTKGVLQENIQIVSNADNEENSAILSGAYMARPEGGNEIHAQQVLDAFGLKTSMLSIVNNEGTITPPNNFPFRPSSNFPIVENIEAGYEGDLILSSNFVQADPSQPVIGFQLAAFHGPGSNGAKFLKPDGTEVIAGIDFSHSVNWYQTFLPRDNSNISISSNQVLSIEEPFRIAIANRYSTSGGNNLNNSRPDLLGVRVYKVKDQNGEIIPNEYIAIQDFIGNGCGAGSANCDWNDNVFYFINIRPQTAPTASDIDPLLITANVPFSYDISTFFDKGYTGNSLTYSVAEVPGQLLPDWLIIDSATGTITGTPPEAEATSYSVTIVATDVNDITVSSPLVLMINGAPIATDDTVTTSVNTAILLDQLLDNDSEPNGEQLSIDSVGEAQNGTVVLDTLQNTILYTPNIDYTGTDQFSYTVSDESGFTSTASVFVSVVATNQAPVATAIASLISGEAPLQIAFTGDTSTDDSEVVSYLWDFKDGETLNIANPTHTFDTPGSFEVSLTVSDADGLSDEALITITVTAPEPVAGEILGFTLVNAETNTDIIPLEEGTIVNSDQLINSSASIVASATSVGSVVLNLSGELNQTRTESVAPYALFGDRSGNYRGVDFLPGTYTISATPYSDTGGNGTAGTPLSVTFEIAESTQEEFVFGNAENDDSQRYQIEMYPNPAQTYVNIKILNAALGIQELYVQNYQGLMVASTNPVDSSSQEYSISLGGATPGIYILTIIDKEGYVQKEKLIVE